MRKVLLSLLALLTWLSAIAQNRSVDTSDLRDHVRYLASDELEGRLSGTDGNRLAAEYIAQHFKNAGLHPGGDDGTYIQEFQFVSSVRTGPSNSLDLQVSGLEDIPAPDPFSDFIPLGFSANESVDGSVVFVGYGISDPDGYDDYAGLDVDGKIVIALRYSPDGNNPHGELYRHGTFRNKARAAREKGAAGLIIVNGPSDDPDDELIKLRYDHAFGSSGIPVISMKRWPVEKILGLRGTSLQELQESINEKREPASFEVPEAHVSLTCDLIKVESTSSNIIGYIEGSDESLKEEALVIGAHMDHLGYGGEGSGSLSPDDHAIHNGADDNASGTAALLELTDMMGRESYSRSVVFIAFSGEELGTIGSSYYVRNPLIPLEKTIAMVNMDMVGRLVDNELTVYGTGTSSGWNDLLDDHNRDYGFELKRVEDGYGPSDHSQFYGRDIPVLFFFTGTHSDYHKPSDDWDLLNYTGLAGIVGMVGSIATDLANETSRPDLVKVASSQTSGDMSASRAFRVTLGIIPDYGSSEEGLKIGGVRPEGPAEKAGLQSGDLIVGMGGKRILSIYDYMAILGDLNPGDVVDVEVQRGEEQITLKAEMTKRN